MTAASKSYANHHDTHKEKQPLIDKRLDNHGRDMQQFTDADTDAHTDTDTDTDTDAETEAEAETETDRETVDGPLPSSSSCSYFFPSLCLLLLLVLCSLGWFYYRVSVPAESVSLPLRSVVPSRVTVGIAANDSFSFLMLQETQSRTVWTVTAATYNRMECVEYLSSLVLWSLNLFTPSSAVNAPAASVFVGVAPDENNKDQDRAHLLSYISSPALISALSFSGLAPTPPLPNITIQHLQASPAFLPPAWTANCSRPSGTTRYVQDLVVIQLSQDAHLTASLLQQLQRGVPCIRVLIVWGNMMQIQPVWPLMDSFPAYRIYCTGTICAVVLWHESPIGLREQHAESDMVLDANLDFLFGGPQLTSASLANLTHVFAQAQAKQNDSHFTPSSLYHPAQCFRGGLYGSTAINDNPVYANTLPITASVWYHMLGYRTHAVLVGDTWMEWASPPSSTAVSSLSPILVVSSTLYYSILRGSMVVMTPGSVAPYPSSTYAQLSRMFVAANPMLHDQDYLVTHDTDIMPLNWHFFRGQMDWSWDLNDRPARVHIWNSHCCGQFDFQDRRDDNRHSIRHFAFSYVGTNVRTWKEIINGGGRLHTLDDYITRSLDTETDERWSRTQNRALIELTFQRGWYADELILSRRLNEWPQLAQRAQEIPTIPGRVDRANPQPVGNLPLVSDCHFDKTILKDSQWVVKQYRELIAKLVTRRQMTRLQTYADKIAPLLPG